VHAADPVAKCQSAKVKAMGKYVACRTKTEAKAALRGLPVDTARLTRCADKFVSGWSKAETKGAGQCADPPGSDEQLAEATSALYADWAAGYVAGGEADICATGCCDQCEADLQTCEGDLTTCDGNLGICQGDLATCETNALCGNGVIDAGEDCDFRDLSGETCTTQGLFGDGLACTPGTCVFDTSGCSTTRYEDTGLGTVIDHATGLEWQKTDDAGGPTDKDNTYTWSDIGGGDDTDPDGSVFTEFLAGLNNGTASMGSGNNSGPTTGCYADHCDWRIPLIGELETTVDCTAGSPCIDQSVFGETNETSFYWAATTVAGKPYRAWFLESSNGLPDNADGGKLNPLNVRAVRGCS
jgi:hypothetical protein